MKITANPERINVQYTGHFAEPIFGVLGNPAKLYTNLLRRLEPFGANVGGLSINLAVLAQANVSCLLPNGRGFLRVSIDRLELFVQGVQTQAEFGQLLDRTLSAMSDTDDSLRPVRHVMTLEVWARLKDQVFSSYVRGFVTVPPSVRWNAGVRFTEKAEGGLNIGSVVLDEAEGIPEGLYLRSVVDLGSTDPHVAELMTRFLDRLGSQLDPLGLDLPLVIG